MISICSILFLLISILTSSDGQVTCASGWLQYGGSCYLINPAFNSGSVSGTWNQCNTHCTASYPGATMLCVNNAAENSWIRNQIGAYWIWIGYTDMLPYGGGKGTKQYGWVTGCSSTYTNWLAGEPDNNGNNQDYAGIYFADSKWIDFNNQDTIYCGCEYNAAPTMTPSSRPTTVPSFLPSTVPSSRPTASPSPGPTSSPTATPSGDVSE